MADHNRDQASFRSNVLNGSQSVAGVASGRASVISLRRRAWVDRHQVKYTFCPIFAVK
jgi:hypothetical protein